MARWLFWLLTLAALAVAVGLVVRWRRGLEAQYTKPAAPADVRGQPVGFSGLSDSRVPQYNPVQLTPQQEAANSTAVDALIPG